MASISVRGITKKFGSHVALDDVDLEVNNREFVVLLGPSGCGKTTLLNVIAGLERPDHGSVWIGEECVDRLSPGERDVGFVFQNYALYPSKTVFGNLAFALRFRDVPQQGGVSRRETVARMIQEVATSLRIDSLLSRYPSQLSGGQQQRVAMGRALVRRPQAFLFDEPLSNLDALLRVSVRQEIRDLHDELKATMVHVTHDQTEAMSLGDRIVVMREGHILEAGTPEQIYRRPQSLFTASFVGTPPMNLIEGRLVGDSGRVGVLTGGGLLSFPEMIAARYRASADSAVTFGIRSEDGALVDRFSSSLKLRGTVAGSEFQGSTWLVRVVALGTQLVVASDHPSRAGCSIDVFLDMTRFHLFDSTTGGTLNAQD